MRFMMLMIPKGYETAPPGTIPDGERIDAMTKYNEALHKAGVLLALDGLHPPSMGARVSFAAGVPTVRPPGAETKPGGDVPARDPTSAAERPSDVAQGGSPG